MATKMVVTCDFCGKPAHGQATVDVCRAHSKSFNGQAKRALLPCPVCGKRFRGAQGVAMHKVRSHKD